MVVVSIFWFIQSFLTLSQDKFCHLTLYQTRSCIYMSAVQVFWKHWRNSRNCSLTTNFSFFYPVGEHSAILTHYQTTNFRLFQTERVCRRQFQIWRKWKKVIQTGRKHCGKRRNCSLRAISPFPTVFSKGCFPRGVKRCHCVGMG